MVGEWTVVELRSWELLKNNWELVMAELVEKFSGVRKVVGRVDKLRNPEISLWKEITKWLIRGGKTKD